MIARLQRISVLHKVAKLKAESCYSSAFKTYNSKSKVVKCLISQSSGEAIVCNRIIMNSGKGDQIVYMTA
ncbi:hypothetical protein D3C75_1323890 [compost metagenome]